MSFFDRKPLVVERSPFRWPTIEDRVSIVGQTGSGKTQFGGWLLSEAPFDRIPYVVVDFKRERLFRDVERIRAIDYKEVPKHPGVYRLDALPHEEDALEAWLWKVWRKGELGLFFDEGYLLNPFSDAWRAILVTGRSKHIPAFTLSQRPVSLPKWTLSEANFYSVFRLNWAKDRAKIDEFVPDDMREGGGPAWRPLPKFNSHWYDVQANQNFRMAPAPLAAVIQQRFDDRLTPKKKAL